MILIVLVSLRKFSNAKKIWFVVILASSCGSFCTSENFTQVFPQQIVFYHSEEFPVGRPIGKEVFQRGKKKSCGLIG
jgi:hypothetical protein